MAESTAVPRQVLVLYQDEVLLEADGSKGLFANVKEKVMQVAPLNLQAFASNLTELCSQMGDVFDKVTPMVSTYNLESFELALDVTAKGEVKFVGSVGTELKGGIKLVFRRK